MPVTVAPLVSLITLITAALARAGDDRAGAVAAALTVVLAHVVRDGHDGAADAGVAGVVPVDDEDRVLAAVAIGPEPADLERDGEAEGVGRLVEERDRPQ